MYNEKGYYWYHSRYTVDSCGSSIPVMAAIDNIFVCCAYPGIWTMRYFRIRERIFLGGSSYFYVEKKGWFFYSSCMCEDGISYDGDREPMAFKSLKDAHSAMIGYVIETNRSRRKYLEAKAARKIRGKKVYYTFPSVTL